MGYTVTAKLPQLPRVVHPDHIPPNIIYVDDTPTCSAVVISTTSLGAVINGQYLIKVIDTTGTAPVAMSVTAGSLPTGLTLSGATISGTPTVSGAYSFTITATNACGSDIQAFSGTVTTAATIGFSWLSTSSGANSATVGVAYSEEFDITPSDFGTFEGDGTIVWSVSAGLPPGITWNTSTNTLEGTPTLAGTYNFQITGDNGLAVELPLSPVLDYTINVS